MAIAVISRGFAYSSTPSTTIGTTPSAGGAGSLYICSVMGIYSALVSTVAGGGLTWTRLREYNYNNTVSVWTATGTLTATTVTATFASTAYDQCVSVCEVTGGNTIVQHAQAAQESGDNSITVPLATFASSANRPFMAAVGFHDISAQAVLTAAPGYTDLGNGSGGDSDISAYYGFIVEYNPTTADASPYAYSSAALTQYQTAIALELGSGAGFAGFGIPMS